MNRANDLGSNFYSTGLNDRGGLMMSSSSTISDLSRRVREGLAEINSSYVSNDGMDAGNAQ